MKKAFTLIELLMVIALIAIVSTLAVAKLGSVREVSARKVSLANQMQIGRTVDSWMTLEGSRINRLDSLIDDEVPLQGGNGMYDVNGTSMPAGGAGFYCGPDDCGRPLPETVADVDSGLFPALVEEVLTPYSLSRAEVEALANRGLRIVMRHATRSLVSPRSAYGEKGDDGAYVTGDPSAGLSPVRSACLARCLTNGTVVAAVTPFTPAGRRIYRACGVELLDTRETAAEYRAAASEVLSELAAKGGALLAFGLGDEASIVGDTRGGFDAVPYCAYLDRRYYNRYILLFRVRAASNTGFLEFAGVIDPAGCTVKSAREAIERM